MLEIVFSQSSERAILIGEKFSRRMPEFPKDINKLFLSLNELLMSSKLAGYPPELEKAITLNSAFLIDRVEDFVGPDAVDLEKIVFDGSEGGFVCGTNGRRPELITKVPDLIPSPLELIRSGRVDYSLAEALARFSEEKEELNLSYTDFVERPSEIAKRLGVELTDTGLEEISLLSEDARSRLDGAAEREVVGAFLTLLDSGADPKRVIENPKVFGQELGIELSDKALNIIKDVSNPEALPIGVIIRVVQVAVVATIVVSDEGGIISDNSGFEKF